MLSTLLLGRIGVHLLQVSRSLSWCQVSQRVLFAHMLIYPLRRRFGKNASASKLLWIAEIAFTVLTLLKYFTKNKIPEKKTLGNMPGPGLWYIRDLLVDPKEAHRKLYREFREHGIVKVIGISGQPEVALWDLEDVKYAHQNQGEHPSGAGDILFPFFTEFFGLEFGHDTHGENLYYRGPHHMATRGLVMQGHMKHSDVTMETARDLVKFLPQYAPGDIAQWTKYAVLDMFFAIMTGNNLQLTDSAKSEQSYPLKRVPHNDETAFEIGLRLSIVPKWLHNDDEVKLAYQCLREMTTLGIDQVKQFMAKEESSRPPCFMKSLLDKGATQKDLEELMSFFITVFDTNSSLTLQYLFFHCATNPEKQERLYQEVLAEKNNYMEANLPYMEAFFKESHRVTPIIEFTSIRRFENDLDLPSGWHIPAGTKILFLNQYMVRDEKYVENASKFMPERYLGSRDDKLLHEFLNNTEFGSHGRSCLGRRAARIMMRNILSETLLKYKLVASPEAKDYKIDPDDFSFNVLHPFPRITLVERSC